ncbi:MAG: hypothetical protein HYZ48_00005, partial [Chlamydiales bacterium]|nr:hypothetical protein [Chlamydiales bacterium]
MTPLSPQNTRSSNLEAAAMSSLWGVGRGLCVHTLIYPLEVIKIQQQCTTQKSTQIVRHLFQAQGVTAFYRGLSSQLIKTSVKQAWCWPLMTTIPPTLERHQIGGYTA